MSMKALSSLETRLQPTRQMSSSLCIFAARPFSGSVFKQSCYSRQLTCSSLSLELHQIAVSARLNSMHGPLPQHPEDVGQPIDTVLHPGLQLMQQHLMLSGRKMTLIVPRSIDAVLDMYIARNQGDRDPYWCRPWPSAIALAQLILQQPELVKGKRVCDIGCGLGLAGIAAALSGAKEVVMLDREPIALQCSLLSAQACGVASVQDYTQHAEPEAASSSQHQSSPSQAGSDVAQDSASGLDNAAPDCRSTANQQASFPQVSAQHFDWGDPSCQGEYDVALACDVLYEPYSVEPVATITPRLLNHRTGRLLLADPSHRTKDNRDRFLQLLGGQPKSAMLLQESSEVTIRMDEQDSLVQLQLLRMKQGKETVGVKLSIPS